MDKQISGAMAQEVETRAIYNKDIPLLVDVPNLMREVESLEARREWENDRMYKITKPITGATGSGGQKHGYAEALAEIDNLDSMHLEKLLDYIARIKKAESILDGIQSVGMRAFVNQYYVQNVGKNVLMQRLKMSEYKFRKARECIEASEDMAHVVWSERYVVVDKDGDMDGSQNTQSADV